uniref:Alcohol dehydrogenase-like N-terminal domain-containing protein n=1 Tax=Acyrthosiphon pisum TaxID=7029 RepID=A0A8R2FEA7_ACYPI|eukprot:XP_008188689.1 PREDICTED: NDMA-dependent alcohol dehydrogenase-like [Acyrthosiphon pisum]
MGLPSPYSESKPLKIETLELNKPNQNEVLIKIGAAGLCHSDLSVINGSRPRPTPMALGHEAAGEIIEIGDNVTNFEVGDHVVCTFIPNCGHCLPCSEGRPALCENGAASNEQGELLDGGIRLHNDEDNMHHHLAFLALQIMLLFRNTLSLKISLALKDKGVIPDFREPNVIRLAPIALYTSYEEVYKVVEILEEIAQDHLYEQYSTKRGLVV